MPELPTIQALSERLEEALSGAHLKEVDVLGFSGLKTVDPSPRALIGAELLRVDRRGKYALLEFSGGFRIAFHLSQAGRVDLESPPKATCPRGSVVRLSFDSDKAILLREYGSERKASWWVLRADDEGPLRGLGPEPDSPEFATLLSDGLDRRRLHVLLRDQRTVAGIGRGLTDDILHRARLSPFSSLGSLTTEERVGLLAAIGTVLEEDLEKERARKGGLSEARLGTGFVIHNHAGEPCPVCGRRLERVSFESYQMVYCPDCQTKGKVLADRRLSRLLR